MGLACQIIKNNKGDILAVEAPNGYTSKLYLDLLQITNDKKAALDLWAYSYAQDFIDAEETAMLDENGEFTADTVLKRLKRDYTKAPLTTEEVLEVASSFPHKNTQDLLVDLNDAFYQGGLFKPTRDSLSKLYKPSEANYVLQSKEAQEEIKKLIAKLQGKEDVQLFPIIGTKTEEVTKYGKAKTSDIDLTELVGIEDFYEFRDKAKELLADSYTEETSDFLFNTTRDKQKIEVVDEQGNTQYNNSTYATLENTLITGVNNQQTDTLINVILSLDSDLFGQAQPLFKSLKEQFLDRYGLQLPNFEQFVQTKSEFLVKEFLENLSNFTAIAAQDALEVQDVQDFANMYDEFFGIIKKPRYKVAKKSEYTLVAVESNKTEIELFKEQGLIKTEEGAHHKIDKVTVTEEAFIEAVLENTDLLPNEAYYPSAYTTGGIFNQNKVKDTEEVRRDIKRYVATKASEFYGNDTEGRNIIMAKVAFGHPLQTQDAVVYPNIEGVNMNYLTTDFHSDIYKDISKEKEKNSNIYNHVLKYLGFDSNGLFVTTDDVNITNRFKNLPDNKIYKSLRDYFKINKRLAHLDKAEYAIGVDQKRTLYVNNPLILKDYKGEKDTVGNKYAVKNTFDDFIRMNDVVYERVGGVANISLYEVAGKSLTNNIFTKTENKNREITYTESDLKPLVYKSQTQQHVKIKQPKKEILESIGKCD